MDNYGELIFKQAEEIIEENTVVYSDNSEITTEATEYNDYVIKLAETILSDDDFEKEASDDDIVQICISDYEQAQLLKEASINAYNEAQATEDAAILAYNTINDSDEKLASEEGISAIERCEDLYNQAQLMKQAAEETFEEAQAVEDEAVSVYNAITEEE